MGGNERNSRRRRFYSKLFTSLGIVSVFVVIIVYGFINGRFFEALLFLVMWIQLELSVFQMMIYKRSLEPAFTVFLRSTDRLPSIKYLEVCNAGNSVAYGVGVCRVLTKEHAPLDPDVWSKTMKTCHVDIPPGRSEVIAEIYDESILNNVLEVCYSTSDELFKFFHITKHGDYILVLPEPISLRRPLLDSVNFLYTTLWLMYKMKKYH